MHPAEIFSTADPDRAIVGIITTGKHIQQVFQALVKKMGDRKGDSTFISALTRC
jgi:hypothetical protein